MDIDDIVAWAREDNLDCPFKDAPSDCDDAKEVARKLAAQIKDLCGDDRDLLRKVVWIMEYGSILADIT